MLVSVVVTEDLSVSVYFKCAPLVSDDVCIPDEVRDVRVLDNLQDSVERYCEKKARQQEDKAASPSFVETPGVTVHCGRHQSVLYYRLVPLKSLDYVALSIVRSELTSQKRTPGMYARGSALKALSNLSTWAKVSHCSDEPSACAALASGWIIVVV
ncbi:hypothetical protein MRX96_046758 [Rhipicephalus microplus]